MYSFICMSIMQDFLLMYPTVLSICPYDAVVLHQNALFPIIYRQRKIHSQTALLKNYLHTYIHIFNVFDAISYVASYREEFSIKIPASTERYTVLHDSLYIINGL